MTLSNYNEDKYVVDALPEKNPIMGDPGKIRINGPYTDQNSFEVRLVDMLRDNSDSGAIFITLSEGKEACDKWTCLANRMQIIDSMNIPYRPWSPNSNTAVYTAVKACGLPTSGSQYQVGREHPGWGLDLFSVPQPTSVPTPPPGTPVPVSNTSIPSPVSTPAPY